MDNLVARRLFLVVFFYQNYTILKSVIVLDSTKNVPRCDVQSRHRAIGESETKARRQLINKLHTLVARSHSLADLTFVFVVVETMLTSDCGTARTACSVRPSVQFDPGRRRSRSRVFVLLLQRNT